MGEVRRRVEDKRVLELVRSFLKAGVMTETGRLERTVTGTPQGGIISPLLANIALSALDRHYQADWQEMSRYTGRRQYLRSRGHATYRLVRYADDLVIMVKGTKQQAQALLQQLAGRVQAIGLKLKAAKTGIAHIDAGRCSSASGSSANQRDPSATSTPCLRRGPDLDQAKDQGPHRALHNQPDAGRPARDAEPDPAGLGSLLPLRLGKHTFSYLGYFTWWRVMRWLRKKHPKLTWKQLRRRYFGTNGIRSGTITLCNPATMRILRYRYRGAMICTPWNEQDRGPQRCPQQTDHQRRSTTPRSARRVARMTTDHQSIRPWRAGCSGTGTSGSEGGGEETSPRKRDTAPRRRPYTSRCPAKTPHISSRSSAAATNTARSS
jgi:RNA-directed DNA polymerase